MRPPQDAVPQRQLVYQLALAVDAVWQSVMGRPIWEGRLNELLDANPRSAYSTHVLHNIGARRARWLVAYRDERARAGVAQSSRATRS